MSGCLGSAERVLKSEKRVESSGMKKKEVEVEVEVEVEAEVKEMGGRR